MGIGLSVSRSIIESHHGRLRATPNDGPGQVFVLCSPQHRGYGQGRQRRRDSEGRIDAWCVRNPRWSNPSLGSYISGRQRQAGTGIVIDL